jgi:hypothetical protein
MSNTLVLRKVYAVDPITGNTLANGQVLVTDGIGGTTWTPILPSQITVSITQLTNTITNLGTIGYISTLTFNSTITGTITSLGSLGYVSTATLNEALVSTVDGLGSAGYVSTMTMNSTISGSIKNLGSLGYVSTTALNAALRSTVGGLGSAGYISTATFNLGIQNTLATAALLYRRATDVDNQIKAELNNQRDFGFLISTQTVNNTVTSSINGLGSLGYVSSPTMISAISSAVLWLQNNLPLSGTSGPITLAQIVNQVGTNFITPDQLISTTTSLQTLTSRVRFDNVTTAVVTQGAIATFCNSQNIIYISTFLNSNIPFTGNVNGIQMAGYQPLFTNHLIFSTASINFASFSNFINTSTILTLDIYPTFAFTKLGTGATNVAVLPISTILMYGNTPVSPTFTSYVYAGNTRTLLENGATVDSSNFYNSPIRLSFVAEPLVGKYNSNYTLYHMMPNGIQNNELQNALHSTLVTSYIPPTNLFLSIQNIPRIS